MKTEKNFCRDCKQPYTNEHTFCPRNYKNPNPIKKEKIICPQCNKSYSSKQYLREHIGTAHEGKRYACSECDKHYATLVHLKSHIQIVHLKREDFECKICGKKFGSLVRLRNHNRQSHTQMNCEICNKQVNNPFELKKHMALVHNDTKNAWICEICPKRVFFTETSYQKHVQNKH